MSHLYFVAGAIQCCRFLSFWSFWSFSSLPSFCSCHPRCNHSKGIVRVALSIRSIKLQLRGTIFAVFFISSLIGGIFVKFYCFLLCVGPYCLSSFINKLRYDECLREGLARVGLFYNYRSRALNGWVICQLFFVICVRPFIRYPAHPVFCSLRSTNEGNFPPEWISLRYPLVTSTVKTRPPTKPISVGSIPGSVYTQAWESLP